MGTDQEIPSDEKANEFDFNGFQPAKSMSSSRSKTKAGAISVISSKNCKRISLSNGLISKLNNPKNVKFSISSEGVAIAQDLPNNENEFIIRTTGNQFLIYSAPLVNELTEIFKLDFTDKTSITFHEVSYFYYEETPVAMISIK